MRKKRQFIAAMLLGAIAFVTTNAEAQSILRTMNRQGAWEDDKNWGNQSYPDNQDGNSYHAFLPDNWIVNGISSDIVITELTASGSVKFRSADPGTPTLTVTTQFTAPTESEFSLETDMLLQLMGDSVFNGDFGFSGGRVHNYGTFTFGDTAAIPDHPFLTPSTGPIDDNGDGVDLLNNFGAVMIATKSVNLSRDTMVNRGTLDIREGTFEIDRFLQKADNSQTIVRDGATLSGKFLDFEGGYIRGGGTLIANNFLIGNGTAPVWIDPGIHPGDIGTLTFLGVPQFRNGTFLHFDINGNQPGEYDRINFDKSLKLRLDDMSLDISFGGGYVPHADDEFSLLSARSISGSFNNLVDGRIETNIGSFDVATEGGNLVLRGYAPVPEPSTWLLIGLGGLALVSLRKRGNHSS